MHVIIFFMLIFAGCNKNTPERTVSSTQELLTVQFEIPSISSLYMHRGEIIEHNTEGLKISTQKDLIEKNDAYHLGSCTKAMTATLAAILIEEGKLDWSTTLSELLPELKMHPDFSTITFESLFIHRAGLPVNHYEVFEKIRYMPVMDGRELVAQTLLTSSPETLPGSKFSYSNFNYIIAGHILEKLTGKSWEALMKEKIFAPLEMSTCGFGPAPEVWGHIRSASGKISPVFSDNPAALGPAGTVHCSLPDWGKFLSIHERGFNGDDIFLSRESFKKLHSVHPSNDSAYTYGGWLLLYRSWAKGPVLTHAGSNTMNFAQVWIAPSLHGIFMGATNISGEKAEQATDKATGRLIEKYFPQ